VTLILSGIVHLIISRWRRRDRFDAVIGLTRRGGACVLVCVTERVSIDSFVALGRAASALCPSCCR
jgi:hypothetical protein